MSGHSKWANIKHRKGRQDAKRGKVFTRIGKEITIAAREGGGDPEANPRLRLAVQNGRAVNMPMDNITRAIKKGTGEIEGVNYEEAMYEGYGPNGVAVILETVTDNKKRTVSEVRSAFTKHGGNLGEPNSVAWNFERKGVITVKTDGSSEDDILEHVLESGADDMEYNEESSRIICSPDSFSEANKYFDSSELEIQESQMEYIPQNMVKITDVNEARKVLKFMEIIEDLDDVQNVFANFDIDDSLVEQIASED